MPRDPVALTIPDLSSFAKRLRAELIGAADFPGHLSLLNMLARAAGLENFQHLKVASAGPQPPGVRPAEAIAPSDPRRIERALRLFDDQRRMIRWPSKTSLQELCLWVLWSTLPARVGLSEKDLNARIDAWHLFGDRALLRRSLIDLRLFERTQDGREYRRIEREPPEEGRAVIRALAQSAK